MLAYACSPYRGSEPGVGWQRAAEMAAHFEVWVITEEHEFREDIERFLHENGASGSLRFFFVPRVIASPAVWRLLSELRPLYYLAYSIWHRRAYQLARQLSIDAQFDVVHQSTMCGFREPGQLWKLDAAFIWGPVGGTQIYPWRFLLKDGPGVALVEGVRSVLNLIQLRFKRRVREASRRAAVLLTAIPDAQRDFKRIHGVDSICMLDVGVSHVVETPRMYNEQQRPLHLLWSGSLEPRKALHLLLWALAELPRGLQYELRILGSGPRQRTWLRLARRLGVAGRCAWLGWIPHDEAMKQMAWADVFVFTSLRDTCGTVVLEALSQGLPVICLDHQGVASVVTDRCGMKVPVTTPHQTITRLAGAIAEAASDRTRMEALSRGAIDRARDYLWRTHGERLAALYRDACQERTASERPPVVRNGIGQPLELSQ